MEKYQNYTEDVLYSQYVRIVKYFYNALNSKPNRYMDREQMFKRDIFGWPTQLYSDLDKYIRNIIPISDEICRKILYTDATLDAGIISKIVNSNYIHMIISIINKKAELDGNKEYNLFWSMQRSFITVHDFREAYKKFKPFYDGTINRTDLKVLSSYMYNDPNFDIVKESISRTHCNAEFIIFLNTLIEDSKNPLFVTKKNDFIYNLMTPNDVDASQAIITYNTKICNAMIDDILSAYKADTSHKDIQRLREERKNK